MLQVYGKAIGQKAIPQFMQREIMQHMQIPLHDTSRKMRVLIMAHPSDREDVDAAIKQAFTLVREGRGEMRWLRLYKLSRYLRQSLGAYDQSEYPKAKRHVYEIYAFFA